MQIIPFIFLLAQSLKGFPLPVLEEVCYVMEGEILEIRWSDGHLNLCTFHAYLEVFKKPVTSYTHYIINMICLLSFRGLLLKPIVQHEKFKYLQLNLIAGCKWTKFSSETFSKYLFSSYSGLMKIVTFLHTSNSRQNPLSPTVSKPILPHWFCLEQHPRGQSSKYENDFLMEGVI